MRRVMLLHLAVVLGTLFPIPLGGFVLPYIYWRLNRKKEKAFFSEQARNILNFQLIFTALILIFSMIFFYQFVLIQSDESGNDINYLYIKCIIAVAAIMNVLYPIYIAIRIELTKKVKMFYPRIMHMF